MPSAGSDARVHVGSVLREQTRTVSWPDVVKAVVKVRGLGGGAQPLLPFEPPAIV